MVKYTVDIEGELLTFLSTFTSYMEDLFNVTVSFDASQSNKITVTDNTTSDVICYFYISRESYNDRYVIVVKSIGISVTPTDFTNESSSTIGPQLLYVKDNAKYGRTGFFTSSNQKFIVDRIVTCISSGHATNFIGFECDDYDNPMFIISPTNNGNVGFIGVTTFNNSNVGIRTLTYNNQTTVEHNLLSVRIDNSSTTQMTNLFLPESTNQEYFPHIYLVTALEPNTEDLFKFNSHIYLPCMNKCLTILIY